MMLVFVGCLKDIRRLKTVDRAQNVTPELDEKEGKGRGKGGKTTRVMMKETRDGRWN